MPDRLLAEVFIPFPLDSPSIALDDCQQLPKRAGVVAIILSQTNLGIRAFPDPKIGIWGTQGCYKLKRPKT
jgi:hypothetical protein